MALAPLYLNAVVDYIIAGGAPPSITGFFLDLYDGDPLTSGASVLETLTGSATRVDQAANMSASADGQSSNIVDIDITDAAAAGANVAYIAFFTEATDGNLICANQLTVPQLVTAGNGVSFPAGQILIQLV
jgi:hypothetical protein